MFNLLGAGPASAIAGALLSLVGANSATDTAPVKPAAMAPAPTLAQLADTLDVDVSADKQLDCMANAIYFEARGESLEGQLAVADVVKNRTMSERYPDTWCKVIKQKAQFSFVVNGQFPKANKQSLAWKRAKAIAKVAADEMMAELPDDVLWYHAYYVAPKWRLAMQEVKTVGAHTFYRA